MKMERSLDGIKFVSFIKSKDKGRKHEWLPCLLSSKIDWDNITLEELKRLQKTTKWLDRITGSEYRYLFQPDKLNKNYKTVVRSRLKKKIAEWLMCMTTVATFNPNLLIEASDEAKKTYIEQTGRPWFLPNWKKGDGNG